MTDAQNHAARLRNVARYADPEFKAALLAGAEALEEIQRIENTIEGEDQTELPLHERIASIGRSYFTLIEYAEKHAEEALEAQGEWRIVKSRHLTYFIPVERWGDWCAWCRDAEPGEHTAIVPAWAVAVRDDVVITGWRR